MEKTLCFQLSQTLTSQPQHTYAMAGVSRRPESLPCSPFHRQRERLYVYCLHVQKLVLVQGQVAGDI